MIRTTCLLCDVPVTVPVTGWHERQSPAAACIACATYITQGRAPWPMVKLLYGVRCQTSDLAQRVQEIETDIDRLYRAQEDLEQDTLRQ